MSGPPVSSIQVQGVGAAAGQRPGASRGRRRRTPAQRAAQIGAAIVTAMFLLCVATLPWTAGRVERRATAPGELASAESVSAESVSGELASAELASAELGGVPQRRFEATDLRLGLLPPSWWRIDDRDAARLASAIAEGRSAPSRWLGTDRLGRDVLARCLAGGGVSMLIGLAAATLAVAIGVSWGMVAGFLGGRVDSAMMRIVDILFGLPSILLVVLLALAADGILERAGADPPASVRVAINLLTLLVAIGAVSWLTMARVIRGQVLAINAQPFMESCRAIGVPMRRQLLRHVLPNLVGPIVVYATLAVPAAILAESFLSFLGIGIREPLPSWGNLAAEGLAELNPVASRWWLLLWPCLLIALTLLSLNFVGEGLRERFDPKAGEGSRRAA